MGEVRLEWNPSYQRIDPPPLRLTLIGSCLAHVKLSSCRGSGPCRRILIEMSQFILLLFTDGNAPNGGRVTLPKPFCSGAWDDRWYPKKTDLSKGKWAYKAFLATLPKEVGAKSLPPAPGSGDRLPIQRNQSSQVEDTPSTGRNPRKAQ